ncbi:MAG: hypothetical protein AAGF32_04675 [Pseudomonadota bacterium]
MNQTQGREMDDLESEGAIEPLVRVLESLHGIRAAGIAEFLSDYHETEGNAQRAQAWDTVAQRVRDRESERVVAPGGLDTLQ